MTAPSAGDAAILCEGIEEAKCNNFAIPPSAMSTVTVEGAPGAEAGETMSTIAVSASEPEAAAAAAAAEPVPHNANGAGDISAPLPTKRVRQWAAAEPPPNAEVAKPKRDRWSSYKSEQGDILMGPESTAPPADENGDVAKPKRDRWSSYKTEQDDILMGPTDDMQMVPAAGMMDTALALIDPVLDASHAQKKSRWETKEDLALVPTGCMMGLGGMGMGMGMGIMGLPNSMGTMVRQTIEPGQPGYAGSQIAMLAAQAMKSQMELAKNPEVQKIQARLTEIAMLLAPGADIEGEQTSQRLNADTGDWILLDGKRSPSPPPAYDRLGQVRLRALKYIRTSMCILCKHTHVCMCTYICTHTHTTDAYICYRLPVTVWTRLFVFLHPPR